jgi:hypothetical protein
VLNLFLRQLVNKGVNVCLKAATRGKGDAQQPSQNQRQMDQQSQQATRGVRQATRMMRRLTKF